MPTHFREPDPKFETQIFRAYDIRGRTQDQLTPQVIYWLGRVIGDQVLASNRSPICVGADGRVSGPSLKQALICGLRESGADVIDTGYTATPVVYFAAHQQQQVNAVILTASHNPADQNGLKLVINNAALMDDEIADLANAIQVDKLAKGAGKLIEQEYSAKYVHQLSQRFQISNGFKVVVDSANGIGGPVAQRLFDRLGVELSSLYAEVDGRFPNHSPDPCKPENLIALQKQVLSQKAHLGIALDGDGDRVVIIDELGQIVPADDLLMLLIKACVRPESSSTVLYDVKCSSRVPKLVEQLGCAPRIGRTGHSPMKRLMQETNAVLGGELSAHYYFSDWYGFDDGLYTAVRVLNLMNKTGLSVSQLIAELPKSYATPEIRLEVSEEQKFKFMEQLAALDFGELSRDQTDGLRFEFEQGWGLIRASNTEGALVMRFEATTAIELKTLYDLFSRSLNTLDTSLSLKALDLS